MTATKPYFRPDKKYLLKNYDHFNRWIDYYYQKELIFETDPKSVLEIGPGSGVLGYILKNSGVKYKSVDIERTLTSDYIADIRKLPIKDNMFDTVCAFQVLEHIPFRDFEKALGEMRRVARRNVVISIPYSTFYFSMSFQFFSLSIFKKLYHFLNIKPNNPINLGLRLPTFFLTDQGMTKHHYWEMGRKGYSKKRIRESITNVNFKIIKESGRLLYPYHYFYVLKKI